MIRTLRCSLVFFILASPAFGLDLELSTKVDNLYWSPARQNDSAGLTFQGADLFYNVEGSITQDMGDGLQFRGGLAVDPILRNRAYARLEFALDNLTLRFAPFLGAFNSSQKWFNPGLEAQVEYTWPGFLFLRGGFLTTFAPVAKTGDYYLSSQSASVGSLLENGIVTLSVEDKAATFRVSDVLTTVDAATKYWLDTEMFVKNFPLHWAILTGYQATNRNYVSTSEVTSTVHSVLLGSRLSWDFGGGTVVYCQGESALFTVGWNATTMDLPGSTALFQAVAGVRYHW